MLPRRGITLTLPGVGDRVLSRAEVYELLSLNAYLNDLDYLDPKAEDP